MIENKRLPEHKSHYIKIEGLNKSFGKKILFRDFNLSLNGNKIYAIRGESGKGKTTLLRIISGLDKDYIGVLQVQGKVAFCFQEHRLFPTLNAAQNIYEVLYDNPCENDKLLAKELLISLGFSENDTALYPRALSGGMRQRVAFARTVMSGADIMLFDEPTKELDSTHREVIRNMLTELAKDKLIILVSHSDEDLNALPHEIITI